MNLGSLEGESAIIFQFSVKNQDQTTLLHFLKILSDFPNLLRKNRARCFLSGNSFISIHPHIISSFIAFLLIASSFQV